MFYERILKGNGSRQAGWQQVIYKFVKKRTAFLALLLLPWQLPRTPPFLLAPATAINLTRVATAWLFRAISVSPSAHGNGNCSWLVLSPF